MKYILIGLAVASMSVAPFACRAEEAQENLPEECSQPNPDCRCSADSSTGKSAQTGCVFLTLGLGRTTPWTDARPLALKVFEMKASPMLFTPESLYVTLDYAYKGVGNSDLPDGTPREVDFGLPEGEPLRFSFAPGESVAAPAPGISARRPERLMMVDAEGWAVTNAPVYWDLNVGNGDVWRFLASDATGERGKLVSFRDARGRVFTGADFGLDVVRDANGVRQVVTPARLADVTALADGYDVRVWPLAAPPEVDPATGLYAVPDAAPVRTLSVRREREGRRLVATFDEGAAPERYVFDYAGGEWTLAAPSGVRSVKEREQTDEDRARIRRRDYAADGTLLAQTVDAYAWTSWGFARTNRVEGFGGVTRTTAWTYVLSGTGRGNVRARTEQTGRVTSYAYDAAGRVASETETGPGAPTNRVEYAYAPLVSDDHAAAVDTRPRTVVRRVDGIECGRTYYVYTALTDVVERAAAQGAPYGATNALRTVTAYHPADAPDGAAGRVRSVRREDGRLDAYAYALADGIWTTTVTHLHERAPAPAEGRTTRDVTRVNARNETVERRTEAFVGGAWRVVARTSYVHDAEGRVVRETDLAGRVAETGWDCCRKISESRPDGSRTTYAYDADGRLVAESRLTALDLTNDTWVTTCHRHDGLGRVVATWTTNYEHGVGLPATTTAYDALGRVAATTDALGNARRTAYSPDGLTQTVTNPNGATVAVARDVHRQLVSVTGTAVLPEFTTRGILPNGTKWTRTVRGASPESPRFAVRYENMLGQTVREERSGFGGATLTTAYTYDIFGRLVGTVPDGEPAIAYVYDEQGSRVASVRSVDGEWRRTDVTSAYMLDGGEIWRVETNTVSCSDSGIAPQTTARATQLTGLTSARPSHVRSVDMRGNVTESWTEVADTTTRACRRVPETTNIVASRSRRGTEIETVSLSAVTNATAYDVLGRAARTIDGRGNVSTTEYDAFGRRMATVDPPGNRTAYAYDRFGNLASATDPLGQVTTYAYDLRGRKTYEGGATYPVRSAYDAFGNRTAMATYRDEAKGPDSGDVTMWLYDGASGLVTNRVYADGRGPKYGYGANGRLEKRTWARGVETSYLYDGWGNLTNTAYSDGTPSVSAAYDAMGRQVEVRDAAGVTTFAYDAFGAVTNETVVGVAGTNVLERYHDAFGRDAGYALNGARRTTLAYDPATGRIASMGVGEGYAPAPFRWTYLPGSDLKESLAYPNGDVVRWEYEPRRDLVTLVSNGVHSSFRYAYDAAGRRVSKNDEQYLYNMRGELILATNVVTGAEFAYRYDDIGSRLWSRELGTNCTYAANELNQYTNVVRGGVFELSAFDLDGNQTNLVTSTGEWSVEYNGENRPVRWTRNADGRVTTMSYDRMGRRVTKGGERFVYDGYLNIGQTVWDPTEPVATRPLVWLGEDGLACFFHDGNKNVVDFVPTGVTSSACHYAYTPFGADTGSAGDLNPWRFSSEYADKVLDCVYYNYRHYSQLQGRWTSGDPFVELALADGNSGDVFKDLLFEDMDRSYSFVHNRVVDEYDVNGLVCGSWWNDWFVPDEPGGFDFTQACQNHDDCYGTCGREKGDCDEDFLKDMNAVCESVPAKITTWCYRSRRHAALSGLSHRYRCTKYPRSNCRRWASVYHLAVDYLGRLAFNAAQKASGCCPSKGN